MNQKTRRLTYAAMFAVINYIVFTFGKINVPTAPGHSVAIHLANASVVLSAWFLGPVYGGLASAVGLSIADFLDPRYILSAPDRKSTRLNSSHPTTSRMPSSA